MKTIYMLVGVPASGKSWVAEHLLAQFDYLAHDDYINTGLGSYLNDIVRLSKWTDNKPILIETPFSMSRILEPLDDHGLKVIPVFIIEKPEVLTKRYEDREGKPYNKGNISRQQTYLNRALEGNYFIGNSDEVLQHLKGKVV